MKFATAAILVAAFVATSVSPAAIPKRATGLVRGATTLVLKEVGGVPGNECITFRNNGEMVDAACVNTAADRQLTPSTFNGQDVLLVQRSFSAGFRPDLVGKQVCVGFNGTDFRAEDCASTSVQFVSLQGDELRVNGGAAATKRSVHEDCQDEEVERRSHKKGGKGKGGKAKGQAGNQAAATNNGAAAAVPPAVAAAGAAAGAAAATGGATASTGTGACQSGHDNLAQITVDVTGQKCAKFTTTVVTPANP